MMKRKNNIKKALRIARRYSKKAEGGGTKLGIPTSDALTEITHQPMATAWRGSTSSPEKIETLWHTSLYHAPGRRQYGIKTESGNTYNWNWDATGKRPQVGEVIDPSKHDPYP